MPTKFTHTNLIAKDWQKLAAFYRSVFCCEPVPPERHLSGGWLDRSTGLEGSKLSGIHLVTIQGGKMPLVHHICAQ